MWIHCGLDLVVRLKRYALHISALHVVIEPLDTIWLYYMLMLMWCLCSKSWCCMHVACAAWWMCGGRVGDVWVMRVVLRVVRRERIEMHTMSLGSNDIIFGNIYCGF